MAMSQASSSSSWRDGSAALRWLEQSYQPSRRRLTVGSYVCGAKATVEPRACELGGYCPEGSPATRPCASGHFGNETELRNLTAIAGKSEAAVSALGHTKEAILEVHHYRRGSVRGLSSSVTHAITAALDFAEEQYHKVRQHLSSY